MVAELDKATLVAATSIVAASVAAVSDAAASVVAMSVAARLVAAAIVALISPGRHQEPGMSLLAARLRRQAPLSFCVRLLFQADFLD